MSETIVVNVNADAAECFECVKGHLLSDALRLLSEALAYIPPQVDGDTAEWRSEAENLLFGACDGEADISDEEFEFQLEIEHQGDAGVSGVSR